MIGRNVGGIVGGAAVVAERLPRGTGVVAGGVLVVLAAFAGRYGFHPDEMYFVEGGHHLAWSEPDQPIGVPLLAAGWYGVVGGHLWAFRLLPAAVTAGTVVVAALSARELGGSGRQCTWAALATALTSIVPGTGHLFSTTTFDLFGTAVTVLLLLRALRTGEVRTWLWAGVAAGLTLEVKLLLVLVLACCLGGVLLVGPRARLRRPGPYLAGLIALVFATPALAWQTAHGWPMLQVASDIAAGESTSSTSRAALLPGIVLMAGPLYAIVIVVGLRRLLRRGHRAERGWLAVGFLLFCLLTLITGGKAYYPAGFFPALIAAGVIGLPRLRRAVVVPLVLVCAIPTVWFALPATPAGSGPYRVAAAVDPDSAQTIGWPEYVDTVARVAGEVPAARWPDTAVLTANYGEAGALTMARRHGRRLPAVYSGHNAFGEWGPPPAAVDTVVVVGGFSARLLATSFRRCDLRARVHSPHGVENDETGAPVRVCTGLRRPWTALWPRFRTVG